MVVTNMIFVLIVSNAFVGFLSANLIGGGSKNHYEQQAVV
jgi:hypothetical protein